MKSFKSIICASVITLTLSATALAGDITGRATTSGDITGRATTSGDITGRATSRGDITGRAGDITGFTTAGDITGLVTNYFLTLMQSNW